MNNNFIVVSYHPFTLYQNIIVFSENNETLFTTSAPIECIPDVIKGLTSQFDVKRVMLNGNKDYLNKFKAEMLNQFSNVTIDIM